MFFPPGCIIDVTAEGIWTSLSGEQKKLRCREVFEKQLKTVSKHHNDTYTTDNFFENINRIFHMICTSMKSGGNHYFLIVFDLHKKEILYLDSTSLEKVPVGYQMYINTGIELLQYYYAQKYPNQPGINTWPIRLGKDFECKKQKGSTNCGVFTMLYADHLLDNLPLHEISPNDEDMYTYRVKIGTAILNKCLPYGIDTN